MEENAENLEERIKGIYTPLSAAKEEIWRRWNDKELKKKVEDFLGGDVPEVFREKPQSAWFRFIATPNFEFQLAYNLSEIIGLDLVFFEFLNDKFCTRNQDKLHLGKMIFFHEKNASRSSFVQTKKIIDIEKCDNKPFREIKTLWGENFIDFHKRIFNAKYGKIGTFDVSEFKTNGESAEKVYEKVLACFICHGVLFENYIAKDNHYEKNFTKNVVLTAIGKLESMFGVKPLIIPLLPINEEESGEWMCYPGQLEKNVVNVSIANK
jgi:hypothetical protein